MGNPVTLDSDDVEVLLNAVGAAKEIERILKAVKQDPAMIRLEAKGVIDAALDRVNRARGLAIREAPAEPPRGWKPTDEQAKTLDRLWAAGESGVASSEVESYATLRQHGLVVAGQVNEYITWGDRTVATRSLGFQRFKLTEVGVEYMRSVQP